MIERRRGDQDDLLALRRAAWRRVVDRLLSGLAARVAAEDADRRSAAPAAAPTTPPAANKQTPAGGSAGVSGSEVLDACRPDHAPPRL